MVTWLSPLPHTCADQQQKPPATQTAGPLLWPLQSAPAQHAASSSQAVRPWGGLSYFIPHATRQLLAHALFSLYFLHFQQFASLKHTHLLNQGHHLEHDQDYEICNLSLSEQNASRWDNTLISSSVSATILSHFSIFFFVLVWNALKQNPNLSKANKERICSSDWSWVSKTVMKHSVLRPVQCRQWTHIEMRGVIVKLWAKGLGPSLYSPVSTSLFQQQANSKIVYKSVEVNLDSILFFL